MVIFKDDTIVRPESEHAWSFESKASECWHVRQRGSEYFEEFILCVDVVVVDLQVTSCD